MQEDLFTPSLANGEVEQPKSYEIANLFYVAFIGGIIAVSVLGIRNARWLHLEKKYINFLIALSSFLFIGKIWFLYAVTNQIIHIDGSYSRLIARGFAVLAFVVIYLTLKKPFKEHYVIGGRTVPLFKDGVIWCLLSAIIEGAVLFVIGQM